MRIQINQDKEYAAEVIERIKQNNGYCPCKIEKTPETKCMCKEFIDQRDGMCHCGLYIKYADPGE